MLPAWVEEARIDEQTLMNEARAARERNRANDFEIFVDNDLIDDVGENADAIRNAL